MSHVILVAFVVNADTSDQAQDRLMDAFDTMGLVTDGPVDEWWIARDDRRDGSDNHSAVFVPYHPGGGS